MKFKVLGCYGSSESGYRLTSFLINNTILLDAGDGISTLNFKEQTKIEKVILSHAHLDHVCSLPFMALNFLEARTYPVDIYTPEPVMSTISKHIMNNDVWPDFLEIPSKTNSVYRYRELQEHKEIDIGDFHITPIPVEHIVPTFGYIIRDKKDVILYSGDTCDASGIFEIANTIENLRAIVIEVTFSSDYQGIADESKHLTPTRLGIQLGKLRSKTKLYLYHMKSSQEGKIKEECKKLDRDLEMLQQGKTYNFGS